MNIKARWSDKDEQLAEALFNSFQRTANIFADPMKKHYVLVQEPVTCDWLKNFYLKRNGNSKVLMGVHFELLPEFLNDWIFGQFHDPKTEKRSPKTHPWNRDVMAWRIYGILRQPDKCPLELHQYLKGKDGQEDWKRCYILSEQLSTLYDKYLNSRYKMLLNWEERVHEDVEDYVWQRELYFELSKQSAASYARDYDKILTDEKNLKAINEIFPHCSDVHIFGVPHLTEPVLHLLEKMSETVPVTFWSFNPRGDWCVTGSVPSRNERLKKMSESVKNQRMNLQQGIHPDSIDEGEYIDNEDLFLGELASGIRALLLAQSSREMTDFDERIGMEPDAALNGLKSLAENNKLFVHSCYSPLRELEAARSALLAFLDENRNAGPEDALILCADWDTYAPLIGAVFGSAPEQGEEEREKKSGGSESPKNDSIPWRTAFRISRETPIITSFRNLLNFYTNRFEVSAVVNLLKVQAIRNQFGITYEDIAVIQDLIEKSNIHWGYDDEDVREKLKQGIRTEDGKNAEKHDGSYPFTWERGFARLISDMLYGPREESKENISTALMLNLCGDKLCPCGNVENDRAVLLGNLWFFVEKLHELCMAVSEGKTEKSPEEWSAFLLKMLDDFYAPENEDINDMKMLRSAVQTVKMQIEAASFVSEADGFQQLPAEVFFAAVEEKIQGFSRKVWTSANAVLFAPLTAAAAWPHSFVWICGINNNTFPRKGEGAYFDIVMRHPSWFDTTVREKDSFAFLKAMLSARNYLHISYVGEDIHTNAKIPCSTLLNALTEYLERDGKKAVHYEHPVQFCSPEYFKANKSLPDSYSAVAFSIAKSIVNKGEETEEPGNTLDGESLELDNLVEFCIDPHSFILKNKLGLRIPFFKQNDDEERLEGVEFDIALKKKVVFEEVGDFSELGDNFRLQMVEKGKAPDFYTVSMEMEKMREKMLEVKKYRPIGLKLNVEGTYSGTKEFARGKETAHKELFCSEAYQLWNAEKESNENTQAFDLSDGKVIVLHSDIPLREFDAIKSNKKENYTFLFSDRKSDKNQFACLIRHYAGHAAGLNFNSVYWTLDRSGYVYSPVENRDIAVARMKELLEEVFKTKIQADFSKCRNFEESPFYPIWRKWDKEVKQKKKSEKELKQKK